MFCTLSFGSKQELYDIFTLTIDGCDSQNVPLLLAIDSLDLKFITTHPYEHFNRGEAIIGDSVVESIKAFKILD